MEKILVKFSLCLSFDDNHFENWKDMDTKLDHKVHLQVWSWFRPIRILVVYFWALSTSSNRAWKPILILEEKISKHRCKRVEDWIQTKFEDRVQFINPLLSLIFGMQNSRNPIPHKMVVRILHDLYKRIVTNIPTNPTPHHTSESTEKT